MRQRCSDAAGNYLRISGRSNGMTGVTRLFGIVVRRVSRLLKIYVVPVGARGLTKIPNKEVSAIPTGTSIPKKHPTPPLIPVPPAATARNFRQRDFSNFHCTSQRDFPHANGMRNVRWKRRSDKHRPGEHPRPAPSGEWKLFLSPEFVSGCVPYLASRRGDLCPRRICECREQVKQASRASRLSAVCHHQRGGKSQRRIIDLKESNLPRETLWTNLFVDNRFACSVIPLLWARDSLHKLCNAGEKQNRRTKIRLINVPIAFYRVQSSPRAHRHKWVYAAATRKTVVNIMRTSPVNSRNKVRYVNNASVYKRGIRTWPSIRCDTAEEGRYSRASGTRTSCWH